MNRARLLALQVLVAVVWPRVLARAHHDIARRRSQEDAVLLLDAVAMCSHAASGTSPAARSGATSAITLTETLLAFVIGAGGGIIIGFWFARQELLAAVFDPYVKAANALPRVVLAPIFALWFGLGIWSKVALGVTLVFFIVFFNVYQGVKEVSPVVLSNARMLGMNERQLMRHVYWPSALSWMFSSLHTSVGFALVGAVVGEYLGSSAGLGYTIQQAEGRVRRDRRVLRHADPGSGGHRRRQAGDAGREPAAGLAAGQHDTAQG